MRATVPCRSLDRGRAMAYRAKTPVFTSSRAAAMARSIGVTSDLAQRVTLRKQDLIEGFTKNMACIVSSTTRCTRR